MDEAAFLKLMLLPLSTKAQVVRLAGLVESHSRTAGHSPGQAADLSAAWLLFEQWLARKDPVLAEATLDIFSCLSPCGC